MAAKKKATAQSASDKKASKKKASQKVAKKKKAKKQKIVKTKERRKTKLDLPCVLTPKQKDEAATRAADAQRLVSEKKKELKDITRDINAVIKRAEGALASDLELFRTGYETRTVKCELTLDYKRGRVKTKRLDTRRNLDERAMTEEEKQRQLPM